MAETKIIASMRKWKSKNCSVRSRSQMRLSNGESNVVRQDSARAEDDQNAAILRLHEQKKERVAELDDAVKIIWGTISSGVSAW